MKLLFLSTDKQLFREGSGVRARIAGYGATAESVHVVVMTRPGDAESTSELAPNVFLYAAKGKSRLKRLVASYRVASRLLSAGGRWVVSAQDPFEVGLFGIFLKIRFGVPLELQVHTDFLNSYFIRESIVNRVRSFLAKRFIARADSLRVVSERIRGEILARNITSSEKIFVLPVFVDPARFDNKKRTKKFPDGKGRKINLLMMSRLSKEKNIGLAIRAFHRIANEYPDLSFKIIGEGPELKNLQLMVKNLGLEGKIIFAPWTNDTASEYGKADAFLISSNYEGYGMTAVEAMLSGTPVIMTNVGVAGDVVRDGETGFVVPVGSVEGFEKAIRDLITEPKKREAVRKKAEKMAAKLPTRTAYFKHAKAGFLRMKPRLCYVFPVHREDDATHFAYQRTFIRAIAETYDIRLMVERGTPPEIFGVKEVISAEAKSNIVRLWKEFILLFRARLAGYKTIYVHYSFRAAFLAKMLGGKVYYWNCGEPWKYKRNAFREFFERTTYKNIDILVTGTEGLKKEYAKHYGLSLSKIQIMPNWISEVEAKEAEGKKLREKLNIRAVEKVVLFVHRLSRRKGAHYLPEILAKMKTRAILVVVGDGPEKDNLKAEIAKLKLTGRIALVGAVPNHELSAYYALADAFLMPSEEEGFPHVLLEAFAYGLPFVASDVGGVKDIVPRAMYNSVIPVGDTKRFAERLDQLVNLPLAERQGVRTLLTEWAEEFDLERATSAFTAIIG